VAHFCRSASGREANVGRASARFSSAFFLLLLAAICTLLLGFVLPLFALSGVSWAARPDLMIGGLVFSLVLFMAYFYEELINYGILHTRGARDHQRRRPDREREDRSWLDDLRERAIPIMVATLLAISLGVAAWHIVRLTAQPEAQAPTLQSWSRHKTAESAT
jgi:hypothetical protein